MEPIQLRHKRSTKTGLENVAVRWEEEKLRGKEMRGRRNTQLVDLTALGNTNQDTL